MADLYAPPDGPRYDHEPDWLEEQRSRGYDPRRTVIHDGMFLMRDLGGKSLTPCQLSGLRLRDLGDPCSECGRAHGHPTTCSRWFVWYQSQP